MAKHLICAWLVVLVVAGAANAKPPPVASGRVTTLEPAAGSGWQSSDNAPNPFTSVGIVQNSTPTQFADPSQSDPNDLGSAVTGAAAAPETAVRPAAVDPASRSTTKTILSRLPEPGTWVLLLLGLAMIGFALRGLVAANRRLARLETPEA